MKKKILIASIIVCIASVVAGFSHGSALRKYAPTTTEGKVFLFIGILSGILLTLSGVTCQTKS